MFFYNSLYLDPYGAISRPGSLLIVLYSSYNLCLSVHLLC